MSDEKNFLARWSRRKRDASLDTREQSKSESRDGDAVSEASAGPWSPIKTQALFDPASLPPIESIGAASDIRAFLAAGVPADLTRAALRRVWSSDPAVRDFVGLSENSWDFNAPGAMPGFGQIDKEEVGRLLTRLLGEPEAPADASHRTAELSQPDQVQGRESESGLAEKTQITTGSTGPAPATDHRPQQLDTDDATKYRKVADALQADALQHESASSEHSPTTSRRGHGSALPQLP